MNHLNLQIQNRDESQIKVLQGYEGKRKSDQKGPFREKDSDAAYSSTDSQDSEEENADSIKELEQTATVNFAQKEEKG